MRALGSSAIVATALLACGTAKPQAGSVTIDFPSTLAAVRTEKMQIQVFDGSRPDVCRELIQARQAKNKPAVALLAQTSPIDPCRVLSGGVALPEVDFGERAILVVALKGADDLLIGCEKVKLGDGDILIPVSLTLADPPLPLEATACTSLRQRCENKCQ